MKYIVWLLCPNAMAEPFARIRRLVGGGHSWDHTDFEARYIFRKHGYCNVKWQGYFRKNGVSCKTRRKIEKIKN